MVKPRGAPPKLTRSQVQQLLDWHSRRREFSKNFGTTDQLAGRLGVSRAVVIRALSFVDSDPSTASERRSSKRVGRPNTLSLSQFAALESYAAARRELRATDRSPRQMARELKITYNTLKRYIKRPQRYFREDRQANTPPPKRVKEIEVAANVPTRPRRAPRTLRPRSRPSVYMCKLEFENALRNALLRSWPGRKFATG